MEDIKKKKKYNPKVDLSKFTSNKKILSRVVTLVYKTTIKFVVKLCPKFNYMAKINLGWSQIFFMDKKKKKIKFYIRVKYYFGS